jgi:hypothetical protein
MVRIAAPETLTQRADGSYETESDTIGVDPGQEEAFDQFRTDAGGEASSYVVWVFFVPTDKEGSPLARSKLENLFTCPVDQYTVDQILGKIRTEWMAPADTRWLVRVQIRDPRMHQIKFNQLFIVRKTPGSANSADAQPSQFTEVMDGVRRLMADQQARTDALLARLTERAAAPAVPARDPVEIMLAAQSQSMQMMAVLVQAMNGGNNKTSMLDNINMLRAIKGLGDDLSGNTGAPVDDGLSGILRSLVPLAIPFAQAIAARPPGTPLVSRVPAQLAAPQPLAGVAPAPATAAPPASATPVQPNPIDVVSEEKMLNQLREALGVLADTAATNPDPKETAGTLLSSLPEEMDSVIYSTLSAPNWFEQLSLWQPKIAMHRSWFTSVRNEILNAYTTDAPEKSGS